MSTDKRECGRRRSLGISAAAGPLAAILAGAASAPGAEFSLTPADSIQAAIDAAAASPDTTSTLTLGPGVYAQSFAIESTGKKLSIVGAGAGETILSGSRQRQIGRIVSNGLSVVRRDMTFQHGLADSGAEPFGGAVRIVNSAVSIADCEFRDNTVRPGEGSTATLAAGGAVSIQLDGPQLVTMRDCVFRRNRVDAGETPSGALVAALGGAVHFEAGTVAGRIENCVFEENTALLPAGASPGGACFVRDADIDSCVFFGNRAEGVHASGGALYRLGSSVNRLTNCLIFGNAATGLSLGFGGGVAANGGVLAIHHCTIVQNSASAFAGGVRGEGISVQVTNSFIAANSAAQLSDTFEVYSIGYNIFGPATGVQLVGGHASDRFGIDPGFVDAGAGDFRLAPGSPAIDAAATFDDIYTDLTGGLRAVDDPQSPNIGEPLYTPGGLQPANIGAYEFVPDPPAPAPVCASDLTGDGQVDSADLAQLLGGWGPCP